MITKTTGDLQDGRAGEVSAVAEVGGCHHILGIEHLLRQLRNRDCAESVCTATCEWCKTDHEEVKAGERNHVDSELSKVRVELTRESKTGCNTRHDG